ncbi:MAG: L,D-transpeptidase, partial [Pseudolabrys sp.]
RPEPTAARLFMTQIVSCSLNCWSDSVRWSRGQPRVGKTLSMNLGATVYRIHGTNAPETIGQAVSSGCFRWVNDDVADLYSRVPIGTTVLVQHQ